MPRRYFPAAGFAGAKLGIKCTLLTGLSLQLVSYGMLFAWPAILASGLLPRPALALAALSVYQARSPCTRTRQAHAHLRTHARAHVPRPPPRRARLHPPGRPPLTPTETPPTETPPPRRR